MASLHPALALLVAYALGSLSFATLAGRLRGVDVRAHGSGNPGATNVGRVLGRGWGLAVLLLDIGKGALAVWLLRAYPGLLDADGRAPIAVAVVLGHVVPIVSPMQGGKGVATLLGAVGVMHPVAAAIGLAVHLLVRGTTGFVSVASVAMAWTLPLAIRWWGDDGAAAFVLLALVVTWRHKDNFQRMRAGTEHR